MFITSTDELIEYLVASFDEDRIGDTPIADVAVPEDGAALDLGVDGGAEFRVWIVQTKSSDMVDMIVSAGHAEYMLDLDEATVVWDPMGEYDLDPKLTIGDAVSGEFGDDNRDLMWTSVTGLDADLIPADADLSFETIVRIHAHEETVRRALLDLIASLEQTPTGDDSVFDYYPSGARFAFAIAERLGGDWTRQVDEAVRSALAGLDPECVDEVGGKIGLAPGEIVGRDAQGRQIVHLDHDDDEVDPPAPAYWPVVREYLDEADHSGEIPTDLDAFIVDLRLWIEHQ